MTCAVRAYALPAHIPPDALRGGVAVIIDQLRASTTICAALAAGAACVRPCLEPDEALSLRAADGGVLLGGERGGVLIPGFDLGNSPWEYTPERVAGRTLAFTTTNGTKAVLHSREHGAAEVLIGCLANLSALADRLGGDERPLHLVCAGTCGEVSMEDCLAAGAIAERLAGAGRPLHGDDTARVAALLWRELGGRPDGLLDAMRRSRGGRNLEGLGLGGDVAYCTELDRYGTVPRFDAARGGFAPS